MSTWAEIEITCGPLAITEELRFTLCCSTAESVPEFRVRIECRASSDEWVLNELLPSPRPNPASDYL